jgi:FxsC-like protein
MAYEFFFSYSRANNDVYLAAFFADLCEEVRLRRGMPAGAEVAFFDQRALELGEAWDTAIVDALQTSNLMVALASPAYFKSLYCGKEWALFRERCKAAVPPGTAVPPLLKAVPWIGVDIPGLPEDVRGCQLTLGNPAAEFNTKGLRHLLRTQGRQHAEYVSLLDRLTSEIIAAADAHPLPPLAQVPSLAAVPTAFSVPAPGTAPAAGVPAVPASPAAPAPPHLQPLFGNPVAPAPAPVAGDGAADSHSLEFIYVAADPADTGGVRADYLDGGGGLWRPYLPASSRRIHTLLQYYAAHPELDLASIEVRFGPDLIQRIERAWATRRIVVIVVDPWSLYWDATQPAPRLRPLLEELDGRFDYHWCVLVPWNEQDPAIQGDKGETIRELVRSTFDRHARLMPNPMFYRDGIKSVDEMQEVLRQVLTRLREEIRRKAEVLRAVPAGPARAVVSGPGL